MQCGYFYTLNEHGLKRAEQDRMCPNCGETHEIKANTVIHLSGGQLPANVADIRIIPDTASIRVSYDFFTGN